MFKIKFRLLHWGLSIAILGGCSTAFRPFSSADTVQPVEAPDSMACTTIEKPEEKVKLQIIRQYMETGKLHAALAHLDATGLDSPRETYLRAEILRKTGRSKSAIPYYRELINDCAAGNAYHGLGLIAGKAGRIDEALRYLREARAKLPTDVRVRNDLGYALLLDQQYDAARYEFLTALELDENNEFSASNLVLLLLITGQPEKAQSLAVRLKLSGESFKELVAKARSFNESIPLTKKSGNQTMKDRADGSGVTDPTKLGHSPGAQREEHVLESRTSISHAGSAGTKSGRALVLARSHRTKPTNVHPSPDLPEAISQ